jgi:hypothetical protein
MLAWNVFPVFSPTIKSHHLSVQLHALSYLTPFLTIESAKLIEIDQPKSLTKNLEQGEQGASCFPPNAHYVGQIQQNTALLRLELHKHITRADVNANQTRTQLLVTLVNVVSPRTKSLYLYHQ